MTHYTFSHAQASSRHWWFVMVGACFTLVCGTLGVRQYELAQPNAHELKAISVWVNSAYTAVQMLLVHSPHFENETNLLLELGRWFGVFTIAATTWALLWRRLCHEHRLFWLMTWKDHYVICGLGQKGMRIADSILQNKTARVRPRIVIIDPNPDPELADECDAKGVCRIIADATRPEVLRRSRVLHAKEIIAITASDETNVAIANQVCTLRKDATNSAACYVHLSQTSLREMLQKLAGGARNSASATTELRFFDVFDTEARRLLLALPLDGSGIGADDPRQVHLVIIGFGRMCSAVALRAAKMGHFANHRLLRISVIDNDADHRGDQFLFRYPVLVEPNPICSLKFYSMPPDSRAARELIEGWTKEPQVVMHVVVCLDSNVAMFDVGLRLLDLLRASNAQCDLSLRISSKSALDPIEKLGLLSINHQGESSMNETAMIANRVANEIPLRAFGMLETSCTQEALAHEHDEALARIIHADFVRARMAEGRSGDDPGSQPWEKLLDEFRDSNRQQVDHIPIKMRAIGCRIVKMNPADKKDQPLDAVQSFKPEEVEMLAELEHRRWNAERWLAGWQYGDPADKLRRISNYLVDWAHLTDGPQGVKRYDRETIQKIPGWMAQTAPASKIVRSSSEQACDAKPSAIQALV